MSPGYGGTPDPRETLMAHLFADVRHSLDPPRSLSWRNERVRSAA